ncbi:HNH endonuclease [Microbacterium sp.]|uniref:HNH endonuclease n=1 Tax=Microbacterium sp. TaxID=51671 RepID=UPI0039E35155
MMLRTQPGRESQRGAQHHPPPLPFLRRTMHPHGPSLDHIIELQFDGDPFDPSNLRPAHLGCNVRKSNRLRALARATVTSPARVGRARVVVTSRGRVKRSSEALDR